MGSGISGDSADQVTFQTDFPEDEVIGQLYAYRRSDNEVILGTRRSEIMNQRIAIGIQSEAEGTYRCVAENANANVDEETVINVQGNIKFICHAVLTE